MTKTWVKDWMRARTAVPRARLEAAAGADGTLEMTIFGVIGDPFEEEPIMALKVYDTLKAAAEAKRLRVLMNSPGGFADEAIAIYNLLNRFAGEVEVVVMGWAASAASIIAMAADHLVMQPGTQLMIHRAWGLTIGNANDHLMTAEVLESLDGEMAKIYAARSGRSVEEMLALMTEETWFTGEEAVAAGLADEAVAAGKEADSTAKDGGKAAAAWDWKAFGYRGPESGRAPRIVEELAALGEKAQAAFEQERAAFEQEQARTAQTIETREVESDRLCGAPE